MMRRLFALVPALLFAGVAAAQQYPLMDMMADRVIQRYRQASCEQLWERRGKPKPEEEKKPHTANARRSADAAPRSSTK